MNQNPDEALMIAGGIGAAATFIPIGMALAPEAIAAMSKVITKETVKKAAAKAGVSGTIQAAANVSSNVCVNKDTTVRGNMVSGLGGFGVGALSSFFGTFGATVKSAATFAIGTIGDMIIQNSNSDNTINSLT